MQKGSKNRKQASDSSMAKAAEPSDNWKRRKGPKSQGDTNSF